MLLNNIDGFRCEEIGTVIAPVSKGRLIFEKKKKQIITRMKQWWKEREKLKNKNRRTIWNKYSSSNNEPANQRTDISTNRQNDGTTS